MITNYFTWSFAANIVLLFNNNLLPFSFFCIFSVFFLAPTCPRCSSRQSITYYIAESFLNIYYRTLTTLLSFTYYIFKFYLFFKQTFSYFTGNKYPLSTRSFSHFYDLQCTIYFSSLDYIYWLLHPCIYLLFLNFFYISLSKLPVLAAAPDILVYYLFLHIFSNPQ